MKIEEERVKQFDLFNTIKKFINWSVNHHVEVLSIFFLQEQKNIYIYIYIYIYT